MCFMHRWIKVANKCMLRNKNLKKAHRIKFRKVNRRKDTLVLAIHSVRGGRLVILDVARSTPHEISEAPIKFSEPGARSKQHVSGGGGRAAAASATKGNRRERGEPDASVVRGVWLSFCPFYWLS